jgi:hypothetical protein
MTAQRRAQIVPPAQHQIDPAPAQLLHSASAGVVVQKVGQLRSEYRNEGRMFAREVAKHVNNRQGGNATAFVYEETFGVEDRLHFLIHLRSLDVYYAMVEMGDQDRAYRESIAKERVQDDSGGAWDRLFVDGSLRSNVLLPVAAEEPLRPGTIPVASTQTSQPAEQILHSGNAGIVLHRAARIGYGFGPEARQVARELTEAINKELPGEASAFLYEEAFGATDTLHWLIHLSDLAVYHRMLERNVFGVLGRPGTFVDSEARDEALTPHHWGLYATRQQGSQAQPG